MKIKIEFFKDDLIEAISAGVYEISITNASGNVKTLYVGESVFVLVRCATHLFCLKSDPAYFGFTDESINDDKLTLSFKLYQAIEEKADRRKTETELIKQRHPISQSCIADRQKGIEEKIQALNDFLYLDNFRVEDKSR